MTRRLDPGRAKVLWALYLPDAVDLHLSCGHVARMTRAWLERRQQRRVPGGQRLRGKWGRCRACLAGRPDPGPGSMREDEAKTADAVVAEIRALWQMGGSTQRAIGERYGLSQSAVSMILSGRRRGGVVAAEYSA